MIGAVEVAEQAAGDARVEGADREREQLGAQQVDAEDLRGDVAVAHGDEGAADVGAREVGGGKRQHEGADEDQVELRPVAGELEAEERRRAESRAARCRR